MIICSLQRGWQGHFLSLRCCLGRFGFSAAFETQNQIRKIRYVWILRQGSGTLDLLCRNTYHGLRRSEFDEMQWEFQSTTKPYSTSLPSSVRGRLEYSYLVLVFSRL